MKKNGTMDVERYETPQVESISIDIQEVIAASVCSGDNEVPGEGDDE